MFEMAMTSEVHLRHLDSKKEESEILFEDFSHKSSENYLSIGKAGNEAANSTEHYPFYQALPTIIISIFKQIHIIYFLIISPVIIFFEEINKPEYSQFIIHICLINICILIQIFCKFLTYQNYTTHLIQSACLCFVWNVEIQEWVKVKSNHIMVGQIVKIEAHNQRRRRNLIPVNLLPISTGNKKNYIEIETYKNNKMEEITKVPILQYFQSSADQNNIDHRIIGLNLQMIIDDGYEERFKGKILLKNLQKEIKIESQHLVPRRSIFLNEETIIGVALLNKQDNQPDFLKPILISNNGISQFIPKHLFYVFLFNLLTCFVLSGTMFVYLILSAFNLSFTDWLLFFCNYLTFLNFSINPIMFILLSFFKLVNSVQINTKNECFIKNVIKGLDEFGQADTFIMDDYTILEKKTLKVIDFDINEELGYQLITELLILCIIKRSQKFKIKFLKQWTSLIQYLHQKYPEEQLQNIEIKNEIVDVSGCIRIVFMINELKFVIRFNEKVIFSVLSSISIEKQLRFCDKITSGHDEGGLMIMAEILKLKYDTEMNLSIAIYQLDFTFICLIKLKFFAESEGPHFIRSLKNNHNIVIMTSSPYDHFEKLLTSLNLINRKPLKNKVLMFQEGDEKNFEKKFLEMFYKSQAKDSDMEEEMLQEIQSEKQEICKSEVTILALDSSLIGYLGRRSLTQLMRLISKSTTFIIFYNCSQFQKQLCAARLFEVFPQHIFLSNFAVDKHIFKMSNLSVSIQGSSGQSYASMTVNSYSNLKKFIQIESQSSLAVIMIILRSKIYKNQILIWCLFFTLFIVYRQKYSLIGLQYSIFMFYIYNTLLTCLPFLYYLIFSVQLLSDIAIQDFREKSLGNDHFKGVFTGFFFTCVNYSLLPELQMNQIYLIIIFNCVLISNFYPLTIDDSISKKKQIIVISIQILLSLTIILLMQYLNLSVNLFHIFIHTFNSNSFTLVQLLIFLINPFLILILLLFFSVNKEMISKKQKRLKKSSDIQNSKLKHKEILGRVSRSSGMEMRFRNYQLLNNRVSRIQ